MLFYSVKISHLTEIYLKKYPPLNSDPIELRSARLCAFSSLSHLAFLAVLTKLIRPLLQCTPLLQSTQLICRVLKTVSHVVINLVTESAKKKRTRRTKFFCRICHKFDHNMADCFQNPANWLSTLEEGITWEEGADKFGEDCQEGKAWEAAKSA